MARYLVRCPPWKSIRFFLWPTKLFGSWWNKIFQTLKQQLPVRWRPAADLCEFGWCLDCSWVGLWRHASATCQGVRSCDGADGWSTRSYVHFLFCVICQIPHTTLTAPFSRQVRNCWLSVIPCRSGRRLMFPQYFRSDVVNARFILSSNRNNCCLLHFNANIMCSCTKKASASGGLSSPDPLLGLCPWTLLGDFRPPVFFYVPQ